MDREIRIHGQLSHPNIVKLHASFEDEEGVYLVMELHRGDLFKVLDKRGKLDEECVALNVIVTLLGALDYIHDKVRIWLSNFKSSNGSGYCLWESWALVLIICMCM